MEIHNFILFCFQLTKEEGHYTNFQDLRENHEILNTKVGMLLSGRYKHILTEALHGH